MGIRSIIFIFLLCVGCLIVGGVIDFFLFRKGIFYKKMNEKKKKIYKDFEKASKQQIRDVFSSLGRRPSEEQINRIVANSLKKEKKENKLPSSKKNKKIKKNKKK